MTIQQKFGMRVRELRHRMKISQEDLAFRASIDRTYMTKVENGTSNLSIGNIEKIIHALEISYSEFFNSPLFTDTKSDHK